MLKSRSKILSHSLSPVLMIFLNGWQTVMKSLKRLVLRNAESFCPLYFLNVQKKLLEFKPRELSLIHRCLEYALGSGTSIDFGGYIRRARRHTLGYGSVGGFVDLPNDPQKNPNGEAFGLITCSHVVFSSDKLKIPRSELKDMLDKESDFEVEVFDKNQQKFHVCGKLVDKCFPERCSDSKNLVDAALIKLDQAVKNFGFPVTVADQLYSAGFVSNTPPVFKGDVITVKDPDPILGLSNKIPGASDSVIKYGSKTKFTIGNLYYNGVHVRFLNETLALPDNINSAVMYNQIEIQSLPHGTFFEPGDSGAFVFCINRDKTLSCLGMAIGTSTKGSCLVTPMTRILDSFCLPHKLKPCSPFVSTADQKGANLQALLTNLQTNIQTSMADMQTALQTEIGNLRAEVRETNEKIQTEIDNLKTKPQKSRQQ